MRMVAVTGVHRRMVVAVRMVSMTKADNHTTGHTVHLWAG